MKVLETTNETMLADIKAIQDEAGNSTKGGQPRPGVKLNPATGEKEPYVEGHPLWRGKFIGTRETYAIETDADDPSIKRLPLTDEIVERIAAAKDKNPSQRDATEQKLAAAAIVKDHAPIDPPGL